VRGVMCRRISCVELSGETLGIICSWCILVIPNQFVVSGEMFVVIIGLGWRCSSRPAATFLLAGQWSVRGASNPKAVP
jgi:hypothetical protein